MAELPSITDYSRIGKKEIDELVASLLGSSSVLHDSTNTVKKPEQTEVTKVE